MLSNLTLIRLLIAINSQLLDKYTFKVLEHGFYGLVFSPEDFGGNVTPVVHKTKSVSMKFIIDSLDRVITSAGLHAKYFDSGHRHLLSSALIDTCCPWA